MKTTHRLSIFLERKNLLLKQVVRALHCLVKQPHFNTGSEYVAFTTDPSNAYFVPERR